MLELSSRAEGCCPVRWSGRQAVVILPEQVDLSDIDPIREQLLTVLNRGAALLVADMTGTGSLDYAGAEALARVYQRAVASGTELRLVITSQVIRRVIAISGLDRLVCVYPTLEAALAAASPAAVPLVPGPAAAPAGRHSLGRVPDPADGAVSLGVLQNVADALRDAVALTDAAGVLVLVNRRLEQMFGYEHGALPGVALEALIPARRAVGLRKDGSAFGVEVSLVPVPTITTGTLTLAVICETASSLIRATVNKLTGESRYSIQ